MTSPLVAWLMKSPSAQAYADGVQQAETFAQELKRCRHPQVEPVTLSTGELVACVCIDCYEQLPADYIEPHLHAALDHPRRLTTWRSTCPSESGTWTW